MPAIPTLNHMQKLMTDFENEDICLYGCASCGIMVIEARDFDMETRGKFLKNCSQYILTLDEEDDYNLWSPLKRESNNTIVIENSKLMMLHLKYIRPYDPTFTCRALQILYALTLVQLILVNRVTLARDAPYFPCFM